MKLTKQYEIYFGRKKNDLCVHDANDVIKFTRHYVLMKKIEVVYNEVFKNFENDIGKFHILVGKDIYNKLGFYDFKGLKISTDIDIPLGTILITEY